MVVVAVKVVVELHKLLQLLLGSYCLNLNHAAKLQTNSETAKTILSFLTYRCIPGISTSLPPYKKHAAPDAPPAPKFCQPHQDEGISHVFLIYIQSMHIYSKVAVFQVHEAPKS